MHMNIWMITMLMGGQGVEDCGYPIKSCYAAGILERRSNEVTRY